MSDVERYREDLRAAEAKLAELEGQRESLNLQIAEVRKTVIALGSLTGLDLADELLADVGLSEMCETAMSMAGKPLTPAEVKTLVARFGYDIERHSNPLASIHTTLRRMEVAGKVKGIKRPDGATAYERARKRILPRPRK